MPPISAPIEVPAMAVISKPRASISSMAPMCASPLAPPAPSASATRGRRGEPLSAGTAPVSAISVISTSSWWLLVTGERELQHDLHLFAKRERTDDFSVWPVFEHVHQQFPRV